MIAPRGSLGCSPALHRANGLARAPRRAAADGALHIEHPAAPSPWLAAQLAAVRDAVRAGTARMCPHLADGPRVMLAAAWNPGTLVCAECADQVRPDVREDATCDRCRRHVETIHPTIANLGHLILAYGLCGPCHRIERGAPPAHRRTPRRAARPRRERTRRR